MNDKRSAMLKKFAPITKVQLKAVVSDYSAMFPDWKIIQDGTAFVRSLGPVRQMIWFQKMGSAAYRPTHVINTTVLPMPRMLHQLLDVKHREVEIRWHERKLPETVAAMEQQFRPNIRKQLDIAEVLALCEAEARPDATNDLAMLAILYAWLDRKAEALDCCERMEHCPVPTIAPMPEWEEAMRAFGGELADAIRKNNAKPFLAAAIDRQRAV
jgi:hypothetical protein